MTQDSFQIALPSEELVLKWDSEWHAVKVKHMNYANYIATQAANWGADQELKACCEWADETGWMGAGSVLRRFRRPKPPNLKEQALQALYRFDDTEGHEGLTPKQIAEDFVLIRRALETLPND